MQLLDDVIWGNSVREWGIALLVAIAIGLGLKIVLRIVASRLRVLTRRTANELDDAIVQALGGTRLVVLLLAGVGVASAGLDLVDRVRSAIESVVVIAVILQLGLWTKDVVIAWLDGYRERQMEADRAAATTAGALSFLAQVLIWSVVLLLALDNVGVDVTAMVAGLGIGGIAVALALQNILADLFASLAIVLDKPFVIGDFLIVGDLLGVVEKVGLKTTRVRSLSGEQLIFGNTDLLSSRVRNFGRMYERRVSFNIGVTYQTRVEQLKRIPTMIRRAIEEQKHTRFDRSNFARYGDFSLVFESVYYIASPDYNLYMNIQEAVNLRIKEQLEAEGIEFAYPTQTLYLHGQPTAPAGS